MNLIDYQIDIDFLVLKDKLYFTQKEGKTYIKDPIRKKLILLQPEEFVRQLVVQYFISESNFGRNSIQVEKMITIHDMTKRFDIVIYDKNVMPFILIECKAPDIIINQATFDQIAVYNMKINAPFLMLTNGKTSYCAQMNHNDKKYEFVQEIPKNAL